MRQRISPSVRSCAALLLASLSLSCGGAGGDGSADPTPTIPKTPTTVTGHPQGVLGPRYTIGDGLMRMAISDNGNVVATKQNDPMVSRFSISAPGTPMSPIELDPNVLDVAINRAGTVAYISTAAPKVYVLDLVAGTMKSTIPIPIQNSLHYLALSPDESRLFVSTGAGTVWSVPTTASGPAAFSTQLPPGGAFNIAISPSGKAVYVADLYYRLRKLDAATLALVAENPSVGFEMGDIVVSPDEKEVYIAVDSGELWILDATTLARIAYVEVGHGSLGVAMSPDGAQLYVTSWGGHLTIVDRVARTVVKTIQLGGFPQDVKFDKAGTTAIVANGNGWVDLIK